MDQALDEWRPEMNYESMFDKGHFRRQYDAMPAPDPELESALSGVEPAPKIQTVAQPLGNAMPWSQPKFVKLG